MTASSDSRPILITGGAGFIGSNLADRLAGEGHSILIYDALSRPGVERNLAWLKRHHRGRITHVAGDVRDEDEVARVAAEAKAVFHMAAQVRSPPASTTRARISTSMSAEPSTCSMRCAGAASRCR